MPSAETIQPGELLKICAGATKFKTLEQQLIQGSDRLFAHCTNEFRLALTALLQTATEARTKLLQEAKTAAGQAEKLRKTAKERIWRNMATENGTKSIDAKQLEQALAKKAEHDHDPELSKVLQQELTKIKADYLQTMTAVLKELGQQEDDTVKQFSSMHLKCMTNARAYVEYEQGFELGATDSGDKIL